MDNVRLGDVLLKYGYITEEHLSEALAYQKEHKESKKRLGEVLVSMGYITQNQQLHALSEHLGLDIIELPHYHVDENAVERIPRELAIKYQLIAVAISGNHLSVATNDPLNLYALEDIRLVTNMDITQVLADSDDIKQAIEVYYSEIDARHAATNANQNVAVSDSVLDSMLSEIDEDQAPIVRLLNSLLIRAYNTNVSDIHIEPYEKETVVRMRRDGMLLHYMTLSPAIHQGLVARTKILAQMDIAEKRKPQDGHFKIILDNIELNVRVSFIPTVYGEKGVLRLLTTNGTIDNNSTFGMSDENYKKVLEILKNPYGIVYVTGPTGSGKSTTLYSILEYLSTKPVNIATIEDPVERNILNINQTQVNELAGVTFESGLRSLLRQDPDIIMIGETRDIETASISARAAITGHLVFSTLHTNNAMSSVTRLEDMGLPGYMVSGAVVGILAQRLVRKVCPYCKETYYASDDDMKILYEDNAKTMKPIALSRGRGCFQCNDTGYRGRTAIHEIVSINKGLRKMISDGSSQDELDAYARETLHMSTLRNEMRKLVEAGISTIEEMQKVTYSSD